LMLTTRRNPGAESASLAVPFFFGKDAQPTVHRRGGWASASTGLIAYLVKVYG
jgi:hypothetical protein